MTFVVPFDGSRLTETALVRAVEFGSLFENSVLAVTIIPKNDTGYAREKDWIGPKESFDKQAIVTHLHEQVSDIAPHADFRHKLVNRYAPTGKIGKEMRRVARRVDAPLVFIGSENAGKIVTTLSSVGGKIATEDAYDVVIVRQPQPAKIESFRTASPDRNPKPDFYVSG